MSAFGSSKILFTTLVGFVFCLIMMYNLELIRYDKGNIIIHLEGKPEVSTIRESRSTVTESEPTTTKTTTTFKTTTTPTTTTPTTAKQCDQKLDSETKSLIRKALDKTIQLKELFRQQSQTLAEKNKEVLPILNYFKRLAKPLENSLRNDLELLYDIAWKEDSKELQELNRIAQSMISQTQNPKDCTRAKKLHCVMNHMTCGFGCIIHDYGLCAFVSIGESRTLQYDLNQLATYPGINTTFEYPSKTCVNRTNFGNYGIEWHHAPSPNKEVLTMTINVPSASHSQFSPGSVPQHLIERLQRIHSGPNAWWTGHVISYLIRPQKWVIEELETIKGDIEFEHPIVGIHVRRTDKISEASFFDLERYMDHVESWYDRYQLKHPKKKVVRRVYLATDDENVIKEAKNSYPDYKIIFTIGRTFNISQNRKSNSAVKGVLFDALLLKDSDFVVATFSSNIGRLVYELRQNTSSDPTYNVVSLDDGFYYWGEIGLKQVAIMEHNPPTSQLCNGTTFRSPILEMRKWTCELQLKVGDELQYFGYMYHSYLSGGYNRRSKLHGLYPTHKVKDILTPAAYPKHKT
ncbi:alpha-(1,6)-fucosyltransferase-like isoform X2 [Ciona intestinalis]